MSSPKIIGITGGIGAGKTTVAAHFEQLSIPVYYADTAAKHIQNSNEGVRNKIINLLGADVYDGTTLNRSKVAAMVFNDESRLQRLNEIVHPEVQKDFENWVTKHANKPYLIKESALLIETEGYKALDFLIVVVAPVQLRLARVVERDSTIAEDVKNRMKAQITDRERVKYANFTIANINKKHIKNQVIEIHNAILRIIQA